MRHLFTIAAIVAAGILFSLDLAAQVSLQLPGQDENVWKIACADADKPETCRITQRLFVSKTIAGKQQTVGQILGLTVVYLTDPKSKKRGPYLSIQMPLGVDLRPGASRST